MAVKKVIGVNSGSSFDGIDAALFETRLGGDGQPVRPSFLDGITVDWPRSIVSLVMDAFEDKLGIFRLCRLNYEVGAVYAGVVKQLLDKNGLSPKDVSVVGLDGQTIYQEPPDKEAVISGRLDGSDRDWLGRWRNGPYACGLQIGDSSVIAGLTGVTTVTHFRAADHVFGGTGAPLMQYLDYVAFRDIGPVLTLNIGGIANCQLADRDRDAMIAFDTGPGNVMMDCAAQELFNLRYDPEGTIAATGRASREMLDELKRHRFFTRRPPRSAWRLDFGSDYARNILARYAHLPPADILATLTQFTAAAIALSIKEFIPENRPIRELIASGGGVRNATLMRMIQEGLPNGLRLVTSDVYGLPAPYKEAIKFGVLAFAAVNHLANNIPVCSGASQFTIMGRIALAPSLAII